MPAPPGAGVNIASCAQSRGEYREEPAAAPAARPGMNYGSRTEATQLLAGDRGTADKAFAELSDCDGVFIRQRAALIDEFFGCCTTDTEFDVFARPDGYASLGIFDDRAVCMLPTFLHAKEESSYSQRQFCAGNRQFEMKLRAGGETGQEIWKITRPYECTATCFASCGSGLLYGAQEMFVHRIDGSLVARVGQYIPRGSCGSCADWYGVYDSEGQQAYSVEVPGSMVGPSCCNEKTGMQIRCVPESQNWDSLASG
eukprot:SAG22_NODE_201_length_15391_cov_7.662176_13_plen_256_part_00